MSKSKEELKALDLFEGGENGVNKRMGNVIRKGLNKKVNDITKAFRPKKVSEKRVINAIAKKLGIKASTLTQIFNGTLNGKVNYKLFDRLEFPLDLSIYDVLKKPKGLENSEIKEKWLNERKKHPIFGAAAINGSNIPQGHGKHKVKHREALERESLELYVTLRAIKELADHG
jgi:transcriptional regulator with XRE-family HTH domain